MNKASQQTGQDSIIRVGSIKTAQYTNDGGNLFDQSSEKAPYQTVPQDNQYQYVERIHNQGPLQNPAGAGFRIERINGLTNKAGIWSQAIFIF